MNFSEQNPLVLSTNRTTKVMIITDDESILNKLDLNPVNLTTNKDVETIVVDLASNIDDNTMELELLSELSRRNGINGPNYKQIFNLPVKSDASSKRTQIQTINNPTVLSNMTARTTTRKRKADLTCVEQSQCIGDISRKCNISNEITRKCKRCRLEQCFAVGMRKDYILTSEERLLKKKCIEDNRRLKQMQNNDSNNHKQQQQINSQVTDDMTVNIQSSNLSNNSLLSVQDWTQLCHLQISYLSASQSTLLPFPPFQLTDKMSAMVHTIDIQNFVALKLITYLKSVHEFEQLDENDRLTLVKYNLPGLFMLCATLQYDDVREIFTEPYIDEQYAQHCKDLFIYCYGLEFHQGLVKIIRLVVDLTARDPVIVELLLVILIFTKGLSAHNAYSVEPILSNSSQ
ncbi:unnamed protein product, partial [Didymodactylos carnosus]